MKTWVCSTTLLFCSLIPCAVARAQADPTAIQRLQISAFGAATGTWTGLGPVSVCSIPVPVTVGVGDEISTTCSSTPFGGGRNIGITAGLDVGSRPFYRFYPSLELRGTYPIDDGKIDAQKNVLYGIKAARYYGRFHPYVDFLVGRDKIDYLNGGYPNPAGTLLYINSVSNVFSYGGGLDLAVTDHFDLKVDGQFQHIGVPVTPTGHIWAKPISVGVVYHFDFNHHIRYNQSDGQVKGYRPPPPPPAAPVPPPAPDATSPDNAAPINPAPEAQPESSSSPQPPASDNTPPATNAPPAKPSPDTPAPSPQPPPSQPQYRSITSGCRRTHQQTPLPPCGYSDLLHGTVEVPSG